MPVSLHDSELEKFLNDYDQCWYNMDLEKLKTFYPDQDDELIYFDNHKNNDTFTVSSHLRLIGDFFENGKTTESGAVEEILKENLKIFRGDHTACICFYARYKSFPKPAVRSTMYLVNDDGQWKIKHVHCSFEPEK